MVGNGTYAINLFDVREIVEVSRITPVPHVAVYIKGIIDLRGEITTIVDLRRILGIPAMNDDAQTGGRFIVLDERVTKKTGVLVDEIPSVLTVPASDIDKNTQFRSGLLHSRDHKKGSSDKGEKRELVIWIDIRILLEGLWS